MHVAHTHARTAHTQTRHTHTVHAMQEEEMDPVTEVKLWQEKMRIQDRIQARKQALVTPKKTYARENMAVENEADNTEFAPVISLVTDDDSDDSETTMEYPDVPVAAAIPVAAAVPVATPANIVHIVPKDPIVPKTIENLWQAVESMHYGALEPPQCPCKQCPYNTGSRYVPLMRQRYDLMQRLVELERQLYGI